jgi:hypothetical protein
VQSFWRKKNVHSTFWAYTSTLKMEVLCAFESFINFHQTSIHYNFYKSSKRREILNDSVIESEAVDLISHAGKLSTHVLQLI